MAIPQFILVNCLEASGNIVIGGTGRSVAFPVAKTKEGKVLFCTCSHTITDHIARGGLFLYCYADGEEVQLPGQARNNVMHPELNADLSFFEINADRVIETVRFSERSVSPGLELSHARNVCFKEDFPDQKSVLTTQKVGATTGSYTLNNGHFYKVDAALRRSFSTLPRSPHRGIAIRSWPGVSGSPLWDKHGSVLGMVAGGTEELTEGNSEYNLVYLPAKHIRSCLRRFLKERIA